MRKMVQTIYVCIKAHNKKYKEANPKRLIFLTCIVFTFLTVERVFYMFFDF